MPRRRGKPVRGGLTRPLTGLCSVEIEEAVLVLRSVVDLDLLYLVLLETPRRVERSVHTRLDEVIDCRSDGLGQLRSIGVLWQSDRLIPHAVPLAGDDLELVARTVAVLAGVQRCAEGVEEHVGPAAPDGQVTVSRSRKGRDRHLVRAEGVLLLD